MYCRLGLPLNCDCNLLPFLYIKPTWFAAVSCCVGAGVADDIIKWFIKWTETLERGLENKLTSHRVRNTLTELANAYRFWGSTSLSAVGGDVVDVMDEGEDD